MAYKPPKTSPRPDASGPPDTAIPALSRVQGLKSWASMGSAFLDRAGQENTLGRDFWKDSFSLADFDRMRTAYRGCGSRLELSERINTGTGEIISPLKVRAGNFCGKHTICAVCAARVQDARKEKLRAPIMEAVRVYPHAYLVTFTFPAMESWREQYNRLTASLCAFRRMGQKRKGGKKSGGEFGKVGAAIIKLELKRGEGSGLPHIHAHGLLFTSEMINYRIWAEAEKAKPEAERVSLFENNGSKLSREWNRASGGEASGIDIEAISYRPPKYRKGEGKKEFSERAKNWSMGDSVFEQAREVLKYATKFEGAEGEEEQRIQGRDIFGIVAATYGKRLFRTYGDFYRLGKNDCPIDPPVIGEKDFLYATGWNADRYTKPKSISRSGFPDRSGGIACKERDQKLNRIQGQTMRTRHAVIKARNHFRDTGRIVPAYVGRREYHESGCGGYNETVYALEVPAYVLANPGDVSTWEKWFDIVTAEGRAARAGAAEDLRLDSRDRLDGTAEEIAAAFEAARAEYLGSPAYWRDVAESFYEVLAPSSGPP